MKSNARGHFSRHRRIVFVLLGTMFLLWLTVYQKVGAAPNDTPTESEIKAAMIYNFAQFVEWPERDTTNQLPFIVGVFGEDPIGAILEETLKGETFQNRKVQVRELSMLGDVKSCQILYVSQSQRKRVSEIFDVIRGENILTIGDTEDFTQLGGIIAFKKEGTKVRFLFNPSAAARAGLKISSKLLHLAIVQDDGGAKGAT